jgi:cysteinyl-tRNA synthetase
MSKSLKNFVKIGAALERYGARALRLLFLMYKYNAPMDYSDAVMELVAGIERPFDEFFQNVKGALRGLAVDGRAKWAPRELAFAASLEAAKAAVHAALCDDFDTPVRRARARARGTRAVDAAAQRARPLPPTAACPLPPPRPSSRFCAASSKTATST